MVEATVETLLAVALLINDRSWVGNPGVHRLGSRENCLGREAVMPDRIPSTGLYLFFNSLVIASATAPVLEPIYVFILCFWLAAWAGFIAQIKEKIPKTPREIFGDTMYSGLVGLFAALLWYQYFEGKNLYGLFAVSVVVGFSGVHAMDLFLLYVSGGGIQITITPKDSDKHVSKPDDRTE